METVTHGKKNLQQRGADPRTAEVQGKKEVADRFEKVCNRKICLSCLCSIFGLDIKNIRQWFEYQFPEGINWESFGKNWQFDHIIPVTYFDFSIEEELRICWNFTNLRVEKFLLNKDRGNRMDLLMAKKLFQELHELTHYKAYLKLLNKIDQIEMSGYAKPEAQQAFIRDRMDYLQLIEGYSQFEFELLNSGRSIEEVKKEIQFFKKTFEK